MKQDALNHQYHRYRLRAERERHEHKEERPKAERNKGKRRNIENREMKQVTGKKKQTRGREIQVINK
jgi:hypothetical protein